MLLVTIGFLAMVCLASCLNLGPLVTAATQLISSEMSDRSRRELYKRIRDETLEDRSYVNDIYGSLRTGQNRASQRITDNLGRSSEGFYGSRGGAYDQAYRPIQAGYLGNLAKTEQAGQGIIQGYQDRYRRGLANLEGAGQFARSEINRNAANEARGQQAALLRTGLSGSTVANSAAAGANERRTRALGSLNEQLRQERLAVDAGLSGEALAAMTDQQRLSAGLRTDVYGALGNIAGGRFAAANDAYAQNFANQRDLRFGHLDRQRELAELEARPYEETVRQPV